MTTSTEWRPTERTRIVSLDRYVSYPHPWTEEDLRRVVEREMAAEVAAAVERECGIPAPDITSSLALHKPAHWQRTALRYARPDEGDDVPAFVECTDGEEPEIMRLTLRVAVDPENGLRP